MFQWFNINKEVDQSDEDQRSADANQNKETYFTGWGLTHMPGPLRTPSRWFCCHLLQKIQIAARIYHRQFGEIMEYSLFLFYNFFFQNKNGWSKYLTSQTTCLCLFCFSVTPHNFTIQIKWELIIQLSLTLNMLPTIVKYFFPLYIIVFQLYIFPLNEFNQF